MTARELDSYSRQLRKGFASGAPRVVRQLKAQDTSSLDGRGQSTEESLIETRVPAARGDSRKDNYELRI